MVVTDRRENPWDESKEYLFSLIIFTLEVNS